MDLTPKSYDRTRFLAEESNAAVDLEFLWRVIHSKRWLIFTITAITFSVATLHVLRLPNLYTARTKILSEGFDRSAFKNPEMLGIDTQYQGRADYRTRMELIKRRPMLEKVAYQLNLAEHYAKSYPSVKTNEQAAQILYYKIGAKLIRNTSIIELSVNDFDPVMAAKIADTVSESYVQESWRERLFIADQLLKWFPEEGKLLSDSSGIEQLRKLEREDAVASLPSVISDRVVGSIKQERLAISGTIKEFSKRYTREHPKMIELFARLDYLDHALRAQVEKILSGLKSGLVGEFGINDVKLVENAIVPDGPSGPPRMSFVFACTVLALFGGVALSFLLYHLDQNIGSEEDMKRLPLTFLGYVPLLRGRNGTSEKIEPRGLVDRILSDARLMDEITNVRAAILFSMPAERSKLIMCTSSIPEEGKTTVASMLSVSLSEAGERVLLVDADMRKPALHQIFDLENKRGLSDCLVGSARPEDVVHSVRKVPGLYVMTAGGKTPNPAILLSSVSLDRLIEELQASYGKIIFDVPPALHVADAPILASKVHGTVLIFHAGKIHRSVGKKMRERIMSTNSLIIGGVINRVEYKKLTYPYYRYYRHYEDYYYGLEGSERETHVFQS